MADEMMKFMIGIRNSYLIFMEHVIGLLDMLQAAIVSHPLDQEQGLANREQWGKMPHRLQLQPPSPRSGGYLVFVLHPHEPNRATSYVVDSRR